jgi:hypothetical protein
MHHLVADVGVQEAWKIRCVCRAFAGQITHDIFSKQHLDMEVDTSRQFHKLFVQNEGLMRIVRQNPGLYLFHRVKMFEKDRFRFDLPAPIGLMTEFITGIFELDPEDKNDILRTLCDGIAAHFRKENGCEDGERYFHWHCLVGPLALGQISYNMKFSPPLKAENKLNAAMLFGAYQLCFQLLPEFLDKLGENERVYFKGG